MGVILEIQNATKYYGKRKVVDNVSFSVNTGEVFGFLGPNGAGKTTTIKMITGLIKMDAGHISVNGLDVVKHFEKAMAQVGGIIENPEMYGYLSGRRNLELYRNMYHGIPKEKIDEVIDIVGLRNRIDEKVRKYSLGMRQRLGLAQALLNSPTMLILDEPTNGLDPGGIKELRDTLRGLAANHGVGVMVSSHMLSEMELLCDRFGVIDNGKMIDIKTLSEISGEANTIHTYLFDVSNPTAAEQILRTQFSSATVEKEQISLTLTKQETAAAIKLLTAKNIDIYSVIPQVKSLEQEFFDITNSANSQIK